VFHRPSVATRDAERTAADGRAVGTLGSRLRVLLLAGLGACRAMGADAPSEHDGSAPVPSEGAIACGTSVCPAPDMICCVEAVDSAACGAEGDCASDVYACTGQANCPDGTVCCVTVGGFASGQDLAECLRACGRGDGTQAGDSAQVCQPSDRCPAGTTCQTGVGEYIQPVCALTSD
jgi:hypothetical protein